MKKGNEMKRKEREMRGNRQTHRIFSRIPLKRISQILKCDFFLFEEGVAEEGVRKGWLALFQKYFGLSLSLSTYLFHRSIATLWSSKM